MKQILRNLRNILVCTAMALTLLVNAVPLTVSAEGADVVEVLKANPLEYQNEELQKNARTMMTDCIISVSCSAEGMRIDISTGTVGTASVLGIKDVVIRKKVWYGWKVVATGEDTEGYNGTMVGASFLYTTAEYGETYFKP